MGYRPRIVGRTRAIPGRPEEHHRTAMEATDVLHLDPGVPGTVGVHVNLRDLDHQAGQRVGGHGAAGQQAAKQPCR